MRTKLEAAQAHAARIERGIAEGSIPAERRASTQRRVDNAQRRYDETKQGIDDRITRLNNDPERGDPSRDPERQAILDDTLVYQQQLAAHRKLVKQVAAEIEQTEHDVLAALYRSGGFTHDFDRGMTPTVGFMVSLPGYEHQIPAEAAASLLATKIRHYVNEHSQLLRNSGNYVGSWINPDNNVVYLDVSEVKLSVTEARAAAIANEQEAFYDKQCGEEIYVQRGISKDRQSEQGHNHE